MICKRQFIVRPLGVFVEALVSTVANVNLTQGALRYAVLDECIDREGKTVNLSIPGKTCSPVVLDLGQACGWLTNMPENKGNGQLTLPSSAEKSRWSVTQPELACSFSSLAIELKKYSDFSSQGKSCCGSPQLASKCLRYRHLLVVLRCRITRQGRVTD